MVDASVLNVTGSARIRNSELIERCYMPGLGAPFQSGGIQNMSVSAGAFYAHQLYDSVRQAIQRRFAQFAALCSEARDRRCSDRSTCQCRDGKPCLCPNRDRL